MKSQNTITPGPSKLVKCDPGGIFQKNHLIEITKYCNAHAGRRTEVSHLGANYIKSDVLRTGMVAEKIEIHNRSLPARLVSINAWQIAESEKKKLREFIEALSLGKVNRGRRISVARQVKYLDVLKLPLEYFSKPAGRLRAQDIEDFEKALNADEVISKRGHPYSASTKNDIRKALKVYLRWRLGEERAIKLVGWLDAREPHKTPDYLSQEEVEKLFNHCHDALGRFLIAVLFDSGCRATELHNIRYEDVELPSGSDSYVKVTLKEEYSKTSGRTISLYWKHSLSAVREFLNERKVAGMRRDEAVYTRGYDATRAFLLRLGKRVLGRSVNCLLFRHSSATYYATRLNRQQLCYRYGWRFSSRMPDTYISRAGMEGKELDAKFEATEIETLRQKLENQQQNAQVTDERLATLQRELRENREVLLKFVDERLGFTSTTELRTALEKSNNVTVP